jgi:hypothetical protein
MGYCEAMCMFYLLELSLAVHIGFLWVCCRVSLMVGSLVGRILQNCSSNWRPCGGGRRSFVASLCLGITIPTAPKLSAPINQTSHLASDIGLDVAHESGDGALPSSQASVSSSTCRLYEYEWHLFILGTQFLRQELESGGTEKPQSRPKQIIYGVVSVSSRPRSVVS